MKIYLASSCACVLVLPCGLSAHLEAGFAIGRGKPTVFYASSPIANVSEGFSPELMYLLARPAGGRGPLLTTEADLRLWTETVAAKTETKRLDVGAVLREVP